MVGRTITNDAVRVNACRVHSPERMRGTADVFYLRPTSDTTADNSLWFSDQSLSPAIIDQILNRLKLVPDFYLQTKPVETGPTSTLVNTHLST
jgi:hypothetical protein